MSYHGRHSCFQCITQSTFTCSMLTIETLEQGVKFYFTSCSSVSNFEHLIAGWVTFSQIFLQRHCPVTEVCSSPCQTIIMEHSAEKVNGFKIVPSQMFDMFNASDRYLPLSRKPRIKPS